MQLNDTVTREDLDILTNRLHGVKTLEKLDAFRDKYLAIHKEISPEAEIRFMLKRTHLEEQR